ncbi:hypothetical protein [Streptomyces sp. NPDC026673]
MGTPRRDARYYVHDDGRTTEGTAAPDWWIGTTPRRIADAAPSGSS